MPASRTTRRLWCVFVSFSTIPLLDKAIDAYAGEGTSAGAASAVAPILRAYKDIGASGEVETGYWVNIEYLLSLRLINLDFLAHRQESGWDC